MLIQPSSTYSALLPSSATSRVKAAQAAELGVAAANVAERSSISAAGRARLAAGSADAGSGKTEAYDTDHGKLQLDIDAYFTPPAQTGATFALPPLLLPSPRNIAALREHVSAAMPQFLAQHGIAAAPASIEYDNRGQMILPADYADAEAFRHAGAGSRVAHQRGIEFASGGDEQVAGVSAGICRRQQPGGGAAGAGEICVAVCRAAFLFHHYAAICRQWADEHCCRWPGHQLTASHYSKVNKAVPC